MDEILKKFSADQKKVVWEQASRLRQAFNKKTCFGTDNCQGNIIGAHTIQRSALSQIARQSHVYSLRPDFGTLLKHGGRFKPKLEGIYEASVFNGFCERHDLELFKPIETAQYIASGEQHFALFFRAVCKGIYDKMQGIESFPSFSELQRLHPHLTQEQYNRLDETRLAHIASLLKICEIKARLDSVYQNKEFRRIQSFVVTFRKLPSILCAGYTNLLYDFNGGECQNIFDALKPYPGVSVSIFPNDTGGAIVFSWLDIAPKEPIQFCNSLKGMPDDRKTDAIIRMLFEYCENIALHPNWWEALSQPQQDKLMNRFYNGPVNPNRSRTCLMEDGEQFDNWQPWQSFFFLAYKLPLWSVQDCWAQLDRSSESTHCHRCQVGECF